MTGRLRLVVVPPLLLEALDRGDPTGGGRLHPGVGWPQPETLVALGAGLVDRLVLLDGLVVGEGGARPAAGGAGDAVEVGWSLTPAVRGRGLGSELARRLVADALARPGVRVVEARVDPGNAPSLGAARAAGLLEVSDSADSAGLLLRLAGPSSTLRAR